MIVLHKLNIYTHLSVFFTAIQCIFYGYMFLRKSRVDR
jgi:hypothetical protein